MSAAGWSSNRCGPDRPENFLFEWTTAEMESVDEERCVPVLRHAVGPWRLTLERRSPTRDQLSDHYRRIARSWSSRVRALGFSVVYRRVIQKLRAKDLLGLPAGELHVLDAGIGEGDLSLALLDETEASIRLDGIDLCSDMLDVSAERLNAAGAQFRLKRADITELPYSKGQFDLVLAGHVLEHLSAPSRALAELRRVLKPGGPLLLIVTRATAAGKVIQLCWGTRCFDEATLESDLRGAGAKNWRFVPLPGPPWCRWLSRACVAVF